MGIQVFDQAPDAETLLMNENAPAGDPDEDVEEEAEAALSTVDAEFGRTTDPVRMYMREMGSVELLTREGEIEIAKRIEDGLKHMVRRCRPVRRPSPRSWRTRERIRASEIRDRRSGRWPDRSERRRNFPRRAGGDEEDEEGEEDDRHRRLGHDRCCSSTS